jgi:hypothetical protein
MSKSESNQGAVIQPLPLEGTNLSHAEFFVRVAERTSGKNRVRAIAKAIHYLNNELKIAYDNA